MPEQEMNAFDSSLNAIRDAWVEKLPQRLAEIRVALQECALHPEDAGRCLSLERGLHGLSGSAGSFGFDEVGMRATELEMQLNAWLAAPAARDFEPIAAGVEDMLALAASRLPPQAASDRLVYLVQDHADDEIANQLRHFGYQVETMRELGGLQARIRERRPAAVLADLEFPSGVIAGAAELARLRQEEACGYATIFLSARSNFESRLATVRAGADSYFAKPLDLPALVDRLDALIGREQIPAYRILMVDDDPDMADYHAAVLRSAGMEVRVLYDAAQVLDVLGDYRPELVLMDVYMPGCDGPELVRLIRQDDRHLDVPIVFLSSETDYGRQLEAIEAGADDFLSKPIAPAHLVSALTSRARRYRTLRGLIMRDSLTGLLNHSALKEQLAREVARAARTDAPLTLAMIDLDYFKRVNDTYGHPVGDQVIRALSRLLQQRLRRMDIIGRYGGEEFGVIMPGTPATAARKVLDDIRLSFGKLRHHGESEDFSVSFSAGIAGISRGITAEELVRRADAALYTAKRQGRDQVFAT